MKHKYDHTIVNGLQIDQLWNKKSPRVKCSDIQKKTIQNKNEKKTSIFKKKCLYMFAWFDRANVPFNFQ